MLKKWPLVLILLLTAAMVMWSNGRFALPNETRQVFLLIPDGFADRSGPGSRALLQAWTDAAREEGFSVEPITDSEFLRPGFNPVKRALGVIVPDVIHTQANDVLTDRLKEYVRTGGQLMLSGDALTLNSRGKYPSPTRMRPAVGVDYALYDRLKAGTFQRSSAVVTTRAARILELPPGSYTNPEWENPAYALPGSKHKLSAYKRASQIYTHFKTEGPLAEGTPLLESERGDLLAGVHPFGRGQVLFVNLSLGYLKTRTDGLLLHSFLRVYAGKLLGLPSLLPTPDGVGGLVLNLHIDSNAAITPLEKLKRAGLFRQGPYSVHITAGPDTRSEGDHLGFDVLRDPVARAWVKFFADRGDAIGSHGGWIHDFFGKGVTEDRQPKFERYLELNRQALEQLTGAPITEYSAPLGNHPSWVSQWLEGTHHLAYYYTGNIGMGPTRPGNRDTSPWAFPVMSYGNIASLEEAHENGLSEDQVQGWLEAAARFAASSQQSRLVYFHPPGLLKYPKAVDHWLKLARRLGETGGFRWYTMNRLASFLNRRAQVTWRETERTGSHISTIRARSASSLEGLTWKLPKDRYDRPVVTHGPALVAENPENWLVTAQAENEMEFETRLKPHEETRAWPYYLAWAPGLKSSR